MVNETFHAVHYCELGALGKMIAAEDILWYEDIFKYSFSITKHKLGFVIFMLVFCVEPVMLEDWKTWALSIHTWIFWKMILIPAWFKQTVLSHTSGILNYFLSTWNCICMLSSIVRWPVIISNIAQSLYTGVGLLKGEKRGWGGDE